MVDGKRYFTVREVAEMLHVHDETVRRLLNKGELRGFQIGRDWRISPGAVTEYVTQQERRAE